MHEVEAVASWSSVAKNLVASFVLKDQVRVLVLRFVDFIVKSHLVNWVNQAWSLTLPLQVLRAESRRLCSNICPASFLHRSLCPDRRVASNLFIDSELILVKSVLQQQEQILVK